MQSNRRRNAVLGVVGHATLNGRPVVIPPTVQLGGVVATVFVGTTASLYPSIHASRLMPTQALSAP